MPENILKKWKKSILPQWWAALLGAFIVGLLAHFYKITNWLPNWDSLVFRYDSQNMIAIGRWFLPVVCSFSSFYDLPFLNGILSIFFYAIGAVFVCRILNVQKKITAFLIGAVVVSFPAVTSIALYNYVADGYSIAFFFAVLAAFYLTREKPNFILGAILITLSVAIYQAYITVSVMLILIRLIEDMLSGQRIGKTLKKGFPILFAGIAGGVLYVVILNVVLRIFSTELLDYQGVNSAASLSGINLWGSLYTIKETFLKCFFDRTGGIGLYFVLNALILVLTLVFYTKRIVQNKIYQKPLDLLGILILCLMLIPAAAALALINAEVDYHSLMRMGYVVFYLFFLLLYEKGAEKPNKSSVIQCWTVFLTAGLLIANQVVIANVSYHKAGIAYEKSYGILIRIADRIEQTSGAENCEKILVIGALENGEKYSATLPPEITGTTDGLILRADDEIVGQSVLCSALNDYCDQDFDFVSGEEKKKLLQKEEIQSMENWPAQTSVKVLDDVVVIKLSEEGKSK